MGARLNYSTEMSFDAIPNPSPIIRLPESSSEKKVDRLGVMLSAFCAVHCMATPFVFLLLPAFGSTWAHPATHWIAAAFVIPIAIVMVKRGFKRHGRKWVLITASAGILLILAGAAAPHVQKAMAANSGETTAAPHGYAACTNESCCPSVTIGADGTASFHVTAASVLTSLGGLLLIATHIGNLCPCSCCGTKRRAKA